MLFIPFGVVDADSVGGAVIVLSLQGSVDGVNGGESGGFVLFACEYKSNTWWHISEKVKNYIYI